MSSKSMRWPWNATLAATMPIRCSSSIPPTPQKVSIDLVQGGQRPYRREPRMDQLTILRTAQQVLLQSTFVEMFPFVFPEANIRKWATIGACTGLGRANVNTRPARDEPLEQYCTEYARDDEDLPTVAHCPSFNPPWPTFEALHKVPSAFACTTAS
ncbi:hypothetical protein CPB85DRAFT_183669 [Mucidula mucida]|nr:hypothetical protein CPB85DRAFT_183669 [Mucidula mucida]